MFGILAKFFRFSGRENGNKFKLSMVIGLIEALASAMKIPAIMYILIGLLSGKPTGKYIGGSIAIMVLAIVVDVICKRYSTVLQTEGGSTVKRSSRTITISDFLTFHFPMTNGRSLMMYHFLSHRKRRQQSLDHLVEENQHSAI